MRIAPVSRERCSRARSIAWAVGEFLRAPPVSVNRRSRRPFTMRQNTQSGRKFKSWLGTLWIVGYEKIEGRVRFCQLESMWPNVSFKLSHPLSIRHASLALGIALMLVSGLMYEYPHLSITVFTVLGSAVFFLL